MGGSIVVNIAESSTRLEWSKKDWRGVPCWSFRRDEACKFFDCSIPNKIKVYSKQLIMSLFCRGNIRSGVQSASKISSILTPGRTPRTFHSVLECHTPWSLYFRSYRQGWCLQPLRLFHLTDQARLKRLFSEDQQKIITTFINESGPDKKFKLTKLRCLNKVIASLPKNGPIKNIDDLLEKYSLSTTSAISACYTILQSKEKAEEEISEKPPKKVIVSRKVKNLRKSITPQISGSETLGKFAALVLTEEYASFAILEGTGTEKKWSSQKLSCWDVCEVSKTTSLPEIIVRLWRLIPREDVNVVYTIPSRVANIQFQGQLYGAAISLICAKNDFKDETHHNIFHVSGRAPAREFNFLIGNEIVSPLQIVSNRIDGPEPFTPVDHVFSRSLEEVTFAHEALEKFRAAKDDLREPLCQSLLLAKTFVELLK